MMLDHVHWRIFRGCGQTRATGLMRLNQRDIRAWNTRLFSLPICLATSALATVRRALHQCFMPGILLCI